MNTPQEASQRHVYLEALYELDGRHYAKHPLHGHYTGLHQERQGVLIARDRAILLCLPPPAAPNSH